MTESNRARILSLLGIVACIGFGASSATAQTATTCTGLPGTYITLNSQPYALCAGAQSVNFGEVTYAKCAKKVGNSISADQQYPFPTVNAFNSIKSSGNIANVNNNQPIKGGYVVSTFSPPASATGPNSNVALYTCSEGGSYAQCDGGLCFESTSGGSSPLWGKVGEKEVICSCPVATTKSSFQIFGPGTCPTTQSEYDKICGGNASSVNNGAILFIGAPTGSPEALAKCLNPNFKAFRHCDRPAS